MRVLFLDDIDLSILGFFFFVFLALGAFFSIAETSLMAVNRYRVRYLSSQGSRSAKAVERLLAKVEDLLAFVLLGNNFANTMSATIAATIAGKMYGDSPSVLLMVSLIVTLLILVFAELTPKTLAAARPEWFSLPMGPLLLFFIRIFKPILLGVNFLASLLLRIFGLGRREEEGGLSVDELRAVILETSGFIPLKHRNILTNVLELETLTVESIMAPKARIEAIDLAQDQSVLEKALFSSHFNHLPAYEKEINNVVGIVPVRRVLQEAMQSNLSMLETIKKWMRPPYFIPEGTSLYKQLQYFQTNREELGLVVDEYGELQGLITPDDIIEEIVGEFTPFDLNITRDSQDAWLVDGAIHLRELKRRLGIDLLVFGKGATTLNGLIQDYLETLPDAEVALKIGSYIIETVQIQGQFVKKARIKTTVKAESHRYG